MKTIPLTQGKVALVDDEDFERVSKLKWCAHRDSSRRHVEAFYAQRSHRDLGARSGYRSLTMHEFLLGAIGGDHINGDGLDNRRANLRVATPTQNARNRRKGCSSSSKFKGVTLHRLTGRWQARIGGVGKPYLGLFDSEEDAARAYDAAAVTHFGEFARLNFPLSALGLGR